MLETTSFAGEQPNRQLVYELRRRARCGIDLDELLQLIADRLAIPQGEVGRFALVDYLHMAFDVGIREAKDLVVCLERTRDGYVNREPCTGEVVVAQIEAHRDQWSENLYP